MRSLSLTRSSCAPVTRSSPPWVANAPSTGSSSMTPGTSSGSITVGASEPRTPNAADWLPNVADVGIHLHVGAHSPQDVDDSSARRVHTHGCDDNLRSGQRRCGDHPEGRRRDIARNVETLRGQPLTAPYRDRTSASLDPHTERATPAPYDPAWQAAREPSSHRRRADRTLGRRF